MIEKWRDIEGYEGNYLISDLGRIKKNNNQILYPFHDKNGYLRIYLWKKGKRKCYLIHRLVANAFIKKEYGKDLVDHINTIRDDNKATNLRWVDFLENANNPITRQRILETRKNQKGKTINNKPVRCIETGIIFKSALDVERLLKIYHNQINKCCLKRKNYNSAGGYHWEYV